MPDGIRSCPTSKAKMVHELIELKERGWRALPTVGYAGRKFYASVLRDDALMLFAGGMRIAGRERILESLGAQPWESFHIEQPEVISLSADAAVLVYSVTARRKQTDPYRALVSSTYVREQGAWRLVVHQQSASA